MWAVTRVSSNTEQSHLHNEMQNKVNDHQLISDVGQCNDRHVMCSHAQQFSGIMDMHHNKRAGGAWGGGNYNKLYSDCDRPSIILCNVMLASSNLSCTTAARWWRHSLYVYLAPWRPAVMFIFHLTHGDAIKTALASLKKKSHLSRGGGNQGKRTTEGSFSGCVCTRTGVCGE